VVIFLFGGMDVLDLYTSAMEAYIRATMEAESHRLLSIGGECRSDTWSLSMLCTLY